ncbi:hypothetical protein FF38_06842 [Lucilia cuprina]|uniref:Uncharacterized protein n=1 Tax=Lucilia cuprina TaxID=7375 RepID=A0A0L0CQ59_LUCCU|nr:hypothetical protein FF38_06842 [Lucilia cuprina]
MASVERNANLSNKPKTFSYSPRTDCVCHKVYGHYDTGHYDTSPSPRPYCDTGPASRDMVNSEKTRRFSYSQGHTVVYELARAVNPCIHHIQLTSTPFHCPTVTPLWDTCGQRQTRGTDSISLSRDCNTLRRRGFIKDTSPTSSSVNIFLGDSIELIQNHKQYNASVFLQTFSLHGFDFKLQPTIFYPKEPLQITGTKEGSKLCPVVPDYVDILFHPMSNHSMKRSKLYLIITILWLQILTRSSLFQFFSSS